MNIYIVDIGDQHRVPHHQILLTSQGLCALS